MRLVVLESPYAGNVERNVAYARACLADCLARGEAPIASHLLYTQPGVLDDTNPEQRKLGINAGFAWNRFADAVVVYEDLGGFKRNAFRNPTRGGYGADGGATNASELEIAVTNRDEVVLGHLDEWSIAGQIQEHCTEAILAWGCCCESSGG